MTDWRGRSLAFVRTLRGEPARYPSARAAMSASSVQQGLPPLRAVVWFQGGPWGDCALSLGDDLVLGVSAQGLPEITRLTLHPSKYLGWSEQIGPGR